jgi:hypothetical protein
VVVAALVASQGVSLTRGLGFLGSTWSATTWICRRSASCSSPLEPSLGRSNLWVPCRKPFALLTFGWSRCTRPSPSSASAGS